MSSKAEPHTVSTEDNPALTKKVVGQCDECGRPYDIDEGGRAHVCQIWE